MFPYGRKGPQSSASGGQHPRDTARLAEAVDLQHLRPSWRAPGRTAAPKARRVGTAGICSGRRTVHRLRCARCYDDDGQAMRSRMLAAAMNCRRRQPIQRAVESSKSSPLGMLRSSLRAGSAARLADAVGTRSLAQRILSIQLFVFERARRGLCQPRPLTRLSIFQPAARSDVPGSSARVYVMIFRHPRRAASRAHQPWSIEAAFQRSAAAVSRRMQSLLTSRMPRPFSAGATGFPTRATPSKVRPL